MALKAVRRRMADVRSALPWFPTAAAIAIVLAGVCLL